MVSDAGSYRRKKRQQKRNLFRHFVSLARMTSNAQDPKEEVIEESSKPVMSPLTAAVETSSSTGSIQTE